MPRIQAEIRGGGVGAVLVVHGLYRLSFPRFQRPTTTRSLGGAVLDHAFVRRHQHDCQEFYRRKTRREYLLLLFSGRAYFSFFKNYLQCLAHVRYQRGRLRTFRFAVGQFSPRCFSLFHSVASHVRGFFRGAHFDFGARAKSRQSHLLMAVLGFPVIIGMLSLAIKVTTNCIFDLERSSSSDELLAIAAINLLLGSASYLLFPYIWRS